MRIGIDDLSLYEMSLLHKIYILFFFSISFLSLLQHSETKWFEWNPMKKKKSKFFA